MRQGKRSIAAYIPEFERKLFEARADQWPDEARITLLVVSLNRETQDRLEGKDWPETHTQFTAFLRRQESAFVSTSDTASTVADRQLNDDPMDIDVNRAEVADSADAEALGVGAVVVVVVAMAPLAVVVALAANPIPLAGGGGCNGPDCPKDGPKDCEGSDCGCDANKKVTQYGVLCSKTVALTTTITGTCSTTKCVTTSCGTATTSTSTTTKTESEAVTMTAMGDTYPTVDPAGALATSVYNDALSWWSVEEAAYTSLASTTTSQAPAPSSTLGARCNNNAELFVGSDHGMPAGKRFERV
ncbi:hypothetical protein N657DRAFT_693868 [Parathielavia appendiculata]|uniref:Retrotransposon gag domain-containing protein n=1 Tax=Parathielavia appendiculata TaxID=2587402 RepID=A0AAN6YYV4_9PEZI|nr:hypothetical protein N657DRAFT_693868 [Parathielavia appendiculata]